MLNSLIRGIFGTEEPPTQVLEVRPEAYSARPIKYREESIVLYGPKVPPDSRNTRDKYYEIVLLKPYTETLHQVYSLFRSENREEAEEKFTVFKEKIPLYIKLTKECTVPSLQKLCDILTEHQGWTIAHLAVHFGLQELFNDPDVQKAMNDEDSVTGATPLMIAIKNGNIKMVQSLLSLKCSADGADREGNTVFHYAAASNKETISALTSVAGGSLNVYNRQGYTPLHTACLVNTPENVKALIAAGADVNLTATKGPSTSTLPAIVPDVVQDNFMSYLFNNRFYEQDMKYGGTPLHWAGSRAVIEELVVKNCNINALNFEGRTALHVMALRSRLECAVALLSNGAEISIQDNDGNTPLHLAVKQSNIPMVQALIVFGADMECLNNKGQTARHLVPVVMTNSVFDKMLYVLHAAGAKRCSTQMSGCGEHCSYRGQYTGVPPPSVARAPARDVITEMLSVAAMEKASQGEPKTGRLLCLDGGGIRGLILVQILLALEQAVGKPIVHCFDYMSGTSTGGILALALSTGRTLRECQRLYFRMKDYAFVGSKPYPSEPLENMLKECLGTEVVMADIDHPKLMIMGVLADRKPIDLHIFRNFRSAQEILDEHHKMPSPVPEAVDKSTVVSLPAPAPPAQQLVWQAARATGAAPSYFRASDRFLDGGLISNNPTLDVLTELAELRLALQATGQLEEAKKTELKVVISCGTGLIPVTKINYFDLYKPDALWDTVKVAWGLKALATLLVDQATQSDGRVVDRARAWCTSLGVPYYRFNPQMSADVDMDKRDDDVLVNMLWETVAYMHANRTRVAEVASLLD